MFESKVIVVTGSSSGIGARTAVKFAKSGAAAVVLTGRRAELLEIVKKECESASNGRTKVKFVVGDITDKNVQNQLTNGTVEEFGRLDVLVNNAAITEEGCSMVDVPIKDFDNMFNVNVRSVILLNQLAIPHLVKSKGNIINISSVLSVKATPAYAYYCMTKTALDHYTRCLAVELGPQGVRVNSMQPGYVPDTDLCRKVNKDENFKAATDYMIQKTPMRRVGEADEIADAIVFLASDQATFITGSILAADGGMLLS